MYLKLELSFKLRKSLACFRCSGHKLNIEIGRYHEIDKDDRICLHWYSGGRHRYGFYRLLQSTKLVGWLYCSLMPL